jgi:hypothetical protein
LVIFTYQNQSNMTQEEIGQLATKIVGDGRRPNKWFVTHGPYHQSHSAEHGDLTVLPGYEGQKPTIQGPFDSYEEALEAYDQIELDPHLGIGEACIEDRVIGTVRQKWLRAKQVIKWTEDEVDDSGFYEED